MLILFHKTVLVVEMHQVDHNQLRISIIVANKDNQYKEMRMDKKL